MNNIPNSAIEKIRIVLDSFFSNFFNIFLRNKNKNNIFMLIFGVFLLFRLAILFVQEFLYDDFKVWIDWSFVEGVWLVLFSFFTFLVIFLNTLLVHNMIPKLQDDMRRLTYAIQNAAGGEWQYLPVEPESSGLANAMSQLHKIIDKQAWSSKLIDEIFEHEKFHLLVVNSSGSIDMASRGFLRSFGLAQEHVVGKSLGNFLWINDRGMGEDLFLWLRAVFQIIEGYHDNKTQPQTQVFVLNSLEDSGTSQLRLQASKLQVSLRDDFKFLLVCQ